MTVVVAGSIRRGGDIFLGLSSHTQVRQDFFCITVIFDDDTDGLFIEFFRELRCIEDHKRLCPGELLAETWGSSKVECQQGHTRAVNELRSGATEGMAGDTCDT